MSVEIDMKTEIKAHVLRRYSKPKYQPDTKINVGDEFTLFPVSDVHWPDHDEDRLKDWMDTVLATPNGMVPIVGDIFDRFRGKVQKYLLAYREDDTLYNGVATMLLEQVSEAAEFFQPVAERIITAVKGNHGFQFDDGQNMDQKLVMALGKGDRYHAPFSFTRFVFADGQYRDGLFHHTGGMTGGGTRGGDENRFRRVVAAHHADMVVLGHSHRTFTSNGTAHTRVDSTWMPNHNGDITPWDCLFVNSGTFQKQEYDHGYGGERLLGPTDSCWMRITGELRPNGDIILRAAKED